MAPAATFAHGLNRPQTRVFLHMMGIPYARHASTVKGLKAQVQDLIIEKRHTPDWDFVQRCIRALREGTFTLDQPTRHIEPDKVDTNQLITDAAREAQAHIGFKMGWAEREMGKLKTEAMADVGTQIAALETYVRNDMATSLREYAIKQAEGHKRLDIKVGRNARVKMDEVLPDEFEIMLKLAAVGQNILLTGPSGSGKTFLASRLAKALKRPYASQSCSVGMSESQLAGWLLPIGTSGKFSYVPSQFVEMYEKGGVFLFDELDAADENTLIFVNAALAGDHFYLPQRFNKPRVDRHKNFVAVGAANTMGHGENVLYSGRNQLDGATLDRFRAGVVVIDYSAKVEETLVDAEVLAWGRRIRAKIAEHKLERIMSTRVMLDFTEQKTSVDLGRDWWNESYFADWTEEEKRLVQ